MQAVLATVPPLWFMAYSDLRVTYLGQASAKKGPAIISKPF
jgi:hypothetical protein